MSGNQLRRETEELKSQVASLNSRVELLHSSVESLQSDKTSLEEQLTSARAEHERLKLVIKNLRHKLFGRSSERRAPSDERQASLFDVSELSEKPEEDEKESSVRAHTRRSRKSFPDEEEAPEGTFPEHLPREKQIIDEKPEGVPDEDLELVSEKITERLACMPEQHHVIEICRRVYKQKSTGKMFCPAAPAHVFDKRCKVDESFLALMVVKKFLWHTPLYRQHQQLKLEGIKLSRDRMVCWTIQLGGLLSPIASAVAELIRESCLVHCDETTIVVGKGTGRGEKRYEDGYIWPILAAGIGVAFIYRPTRGGKELSVVLKGFEGVLISDAFDVYESFVKTQGIRWQLCWMHIRRNFIDAERSNPKLADEALSSIRELYRIEREIKSCSDEQRLMARLSQSKPILEEFEQWLKEHAASPQVLTDQLMSKAISYVLKRWDAACEFLNNPAIPIDNGPDERALRPIKLGAKNWLHCASEEGAEAASVFYTLIGSALMHGIHPYYYLLDLMKRIDDRTLNPIDLVPHRWKERFSQEAIPEEYRNMIRAGAPFVGDPDRALREVTQAKGPAP